MVTDITYLWMWWDTVKMDKVFSIYIVLWIQHTVYQLYQTYNTMEQPYTEMNADTNEDMNIVLTELREAMEGDHTCVGVDLIHNV